MANDHVNKLTGFRVQAQIPLNAKENVASEYILKNLGENNQLAFTYEKGLIVYCQLEGTRYEWREPTLEEENNEEGLLISSFTYPAGLIVNNVDYSNKTYNFFLASSQVNADWDSNSGLSQILNKPDFELSPLQLLYENSKSGIAIRNRNSLNYGPIGQYAVDLSFSSSTSELYGATSTLAFASGIHNIASGYCSSSMGSDNISSAQYSFTFGFSNISSEVNAICIGRQNISSKPDSITIGLSNIASGLSSIALGSGNFSRSYSEISLGVNSTDYNPVGIISYSLNDRLFNIGNGSSSSNKSDAFTILKNGLATLPSVTNSLILNEPTGKAIVTREYLTNVLGSFSAGGIQDSIIYNPLIDTEAVVQLEYGASITFKGQEGSNLTSPYLKLDTYQSESSGDYAVAEIGITDSTGSYFERGIQINSQSYSIDLYNPTGFGMTDYNFTFANLSDYSFITKKYSDYNFQKTITTDYTLEYSDNNYTIFINNGVNPVNIIISNSLQNDENIEVGFVQQGTGLVTFIANGITLNTPTGLKIKGQNYQAFIQKIGFTNVWHVLGNVIA